MWFKFFCHAQITERLILTCISCQIEQTNYGMNIQYRNETQKFLVQYSQYGKLIRENIFEVCRPLLLLLLSLLFKSENSQFHKKANYQVVSIKSLWLQHSMSYHQAIKVLVVELLFLFFSFLLKISQYQITGVKSTSVRWQ